MSYGIRRQFYKSKQWQLCRESYLASVGRLCEECLKNGRITPAVIVHHKVELRRYPSTEKGGSPIRKEERNGTDPAAGPDKDQTGVAA